MLRPEQVSQELLVLTLPLLHYGLHLLDQVVGDELGHPGVAAVVRVPQHEVAHEAGVRLQVAAGAELQQLPVVGQRAHGGGANLLVAEELVHLQGNDQTPVLLVHNFIERCWCSHQREEARVPKGGVAVDDLVDRHLFDLGWAVLVAAGGGDVGAEEELLGAEGIAELGATHVLIHFGHRNQQVVATGQIKDGSNHKTGYPLPLNEIAVKERGSLIIFTIPKTQYDSGDENHETDDGCILKVRKLKLARAEFHTPTNR